jgi:hypothetical protein
MLTSFQNATLKKKVPMEKAYSTAIVLIPPENQWIQIQEIRKQFDKAYDRFLSLKISNSS